ncbi:MAG: tRNA preQ1(34) S-adenosylmethionine ribosyltransferase-isomerase QueA [Thermodesulfobacteriota bacterium]|nr:tRNA preQ1(34) S-adenosylmethionine ribosyltransferase-isomerase QueA [Thermodesulfobacteriota bacterium]
MTQILRKKAIYGWKLTSNIKFYNPMYSINDYDYSLPENLIAQAPVEGRDQSHLLVLDRQTGPVAHHHFCNLPDFLSPEDVIVINNTKVVPARLLGKKATGGRVEALILDYPGQVSPAGIICQCLLKASKQLKPGAPIRFEESLDAVVEEFHEGRYRVRFLHSDDFEALIDAKGRPPLPPYIRRQDSDAGENDRATYQTVYASEKGAVAAPTAGLHFTPALLDKIRTMGVSVVPLTLHVGYGTFLPVRVDDIRNHTMHEERFYLSQASADTINAAKQKNGRIIAVGTTVVRVLEYIMAKQGHLAETRGKCDLFIYPGFEFKMVDAMITNFHLPRSTLLMLVSAFAGRDRILAAYHEAIDRHYRFYSYGDAMLIT